MSLFQQIQSHLQTALREYFLASLFKPGRLLLIHHSTSILICIGLVLLLIGAWLGGRNIQHPFWGRHYRTTFRVAVIPTPLVLLGLVLLYLRPIPIPFILFFALCSIFQAFAIGVYLGFFIQREIGRQGIIFLALSMIIAYLMINFFTFMPGGNIWSKERLKSTFRWLTGRDPTKEEKGDYWEGTTGSRTPSEQTKDSHWQE